jgi:4-hydroxybenzoate polyprenyltransferase
VAYAGLALGALHLGWQVATVDPGNTANALTRFRSNRDYGWILFVGLLVDAWLTAEPLVRSGGSAIAAN